MSKKTHRWKSKEDLAKSTTKSLQNLNSSGKCEIVLNFERSTYFKNVTRPFQFIFGSKTQTEKLEPTSSGIQLKSTTGLMSHVPVPPSQPPKFAPQKYSSESSEFNSEQYTNHEFLDYKKLTVSEYVEVHSVLNLAGKNLSETRVVIIVPDSKQTDDIVSALEQFKNKIPKDEWKSFRLIMVEESFDITNEVLRKDTHNLPPKRVGDGEYNPAPSVPDLGDFESSDQHDTSGQFEDYDYGDEYDEDEDDDAADLLQQQAAATKFRDSRVIKSNQQVHKLVDEKKDAKTVSYHMKHMAKVHDSNMGVVKHALDEMKSEMESLLELLRQIE